jgi:hypothetical protein
MAKLTQALSFLALMAVAAALTCAGCKKENPAPPAGGNAAAGQAQPAAQPKPQPLGQPDVQTKPVADEDKRVRHSGYTGALMDGRRHAMEVSAQATLRNEIKQFEQLQGHLPASLDELKEWRGGVLPPLSRGLGYKYDPATGELKVVNVPTKD